MERDQWLTEKVLDSHWHEYRVLESRCMVCGKHFQNGRNPDFSTWHGFGLLWEEFMALPSSTVMDFFGWLLERQISLFIWEFKTPDERSTLVYQFGQEHAGLFVEKETSIVI